MAGSCSGFFPLRVDLQTVGSGVVGHDAAGASDVRGSTVVERGGTGGRDRGGDGGGEGALMGTGAGGGTCGWDFGSSSMSSSLSQGTDV